MTATPAGSFGRAARVKLVREADDMETNALLTTKGGGSLLGVLSFLTGVVAAGSAAMIGFTSFTAFDPPGWLRILTMAPFPVAVIVSVAFGIGGLMRDSGRAWAVAGLVLAGLSVIAFGVMINVGG